MGQCLSRDDSRMGAAPPTALSDGKMKRTKTDPTEESAGDEDMHNSHLAFLASPSGKTAVSVETVTPPEQQVDNIIHHNANITNGTSAPWSPYDDLGSRKQLSSSNSVQTAPTTTSSTAKQQQQPHAPPLVRQSQPPRPFQPLMQVSEPCHDSVIVEERDPEVPSDEEPDNGDVVSATASGVPRRRTASGSHVVWRDHSASPHRRHSSSSPFKSIPKPATSPHSIRQVPVVTPAPLENQAVHPDALQQFQKLKIQAAVAAQQQLARSRKNTLLEQVEQDREHRRLHEEFAQLQARAEEQAKRDLVAQEEQAAAAAAATKKKEPGFWRRLTGRIRHKNDDDQDTPRQKDVAVDALLFDFKGQTFEKRVVDISPFPEDDVLENYRIEEDEDDDDDNASRQSNLSLLSEASMEAQRKIFAEKARQRARGTSGGSSVGVSAIKSILSQDDENAVVPTGVDEASLSTAQQRGDYGPLSRFRRLNRNNKVAISSPTPSPIPATPSDNRSLGPVSMEVFVAQRGSKEEDDDGDDDGSMISDLGDEYSVSNASGFSMSARRRQQQQQQRQTGAAGDYGVRRRSLLTPTHNSHGVMDKHQQIDPRFQQRLQVVEAKLAVGLPDPPGASAGSTANDTATPLTAGNDDSDKEPHRMNDPPDPPSMKRTGVVASRLAQFDPKAAAKVYSYSSLYTNSNNDNKTRPQHLAMPTTTTTETPIEAPTPTKSNTSSRKTRSDRDGIKRNVDKMMPSVKVALHAKISPEPKPDEDHLVDTGMLFPQDEQLMERRRTNDDFKPKTTSNLPARQSRSNDKLRTSQTNSNDDDDEVPFDAPRVAAARTISFSLQKQHLSHTQQQQHNPPVRQVERVLSHLLNSKNDSSRFGSPASKKQPVTQHLTVMSTSDFLRISEETRFEKAAHPQATSLGSSRIGGRSVSRSGVHSRRRASAPVDDDDAPADERMVQRMSGGIDWTTHQRRSNNWSETRGRGTDPTNQTMDETAADLGDNDEITRRKKHVSVRDLRGSGNDLETAQSSLLLAEIVEAQVEDVLTKFRSYGSSPKRGKR